MSVSAVWRCESAVCLCECSVLSTFATSWTVACQVPLSMEFSRQKYWSGLPFLNPGDLPETGINLVFLVSPALAGGFFTTEPPRNPWISCVCTLSPSLLGLPVHPSIPPLWVITEAWTELRVLYSSFPLAINIYVTQRTNPLSFSDLFISTKLLPCACMKFNIVGRERNDMVPVFGEVTIQWGWHQPLQMTRCTVAPLGRSRKASQWWWPWVRCSRCQQEVSRKIEKGRFPERQRGHTYPKSWKSKTPRWMSPSGIQDKEALLPRSSSWLESWT